MPYLVNGQIVPEQVIREETDRISRDPQWHTIADETVRAERLRAAAEASAVDRILIEQLASSDPRPIDTAEVEKEIERVKVQSGCRSGFDDTLVRQFVDRNLRVQRIRAELVAEATPPSAEEIEAFYAANCANFQQPELLRAAHIVKNVNEGQNEEKARAGMELALAELEQGAAFSEVADRHSDCRDKGGDLGEFPVGYMVGEFDRAVAPLQPGERTGIFKTPFGLHIALLIKRTPAGQATLERVRPDIERVMTFSRQHETYFREIAELRARADIRWIPAQQPAGAPPPTAQAAAAQTPAG